jgi:subtilisin family serine protease
MAARGRRRFGFVLVVGLLVAALAPPAGAAGPSPTPGGLVRAIVTLRPGAGAAVSQLVERSGGRIRDRFHLIDGFALEVPARALDALRASGLVGSVELDARIVAMDHGPNTGDLEYENAWGVEHIGAPAVHAAGITGTGVKVAVIDTGIDYVHDDPDDQPYVVDPEFNGNYAGGYDFVNGDDDPMDDNGHGTHVAGILAAEKNGYLVAGVAPDVDLYALKILNANGEGDVSKLILALQWAVDHDIDVVNMSLGTHEVSAALQAAVESAAAAGVLMVAASGNTVTFQELLFGCPVAYPGAYPQVLATTFTNGNNALTGYSCTGPQVDFASPGDQIFSPVPVGSCMFCSPYGYAAQSGTSMASPHLAGTVALLLDAGIADAGAPGLFDDVRAQLCSTADVGFGVQTGFGGGTAIPTSDPRYPQYFGCGVLDADGAVMPLVPPPPPPGNADPDAVDDTATVAEDASVVMPVTANDTDADGDPLVVTAATGAAHGTLAVGTPPTTVEYTPAPDFHGTDSFSYAIEDGNGGFDTAQVSVTVTPVNDPPVAGDDEAMTEQGTAVAIAVLANDSDVDEDILVVASAADPPNGTAEANPDGTISYLPAPGFHGTDAFTYTVEDGNGGSATAQVTVTVTPLNHPPAAADDTATVAEDGSVSVPVTANDSDADGDSLTVTDAGGAAHGTLAIGNPPTTIQYTPAADFAGTDSFGYTIADGNGGTATAQVTVTVTPVNDPPVAANDTATTPAGSAVAIAPLANDIDVDGDTLAVASVSDPPHGTATANADGTITYTPDAGYTGSDAFGYTATDGVAVSALATVSVTVTPVIPLTSLLHVGDLDSSTSGTALRWTARVTILMHTGTHANRGGVVVKGTWSAGATGTAQCTTGSNGACQVSKGQIPRTTASVTFTVTSATRSGFTYVPSANHDPDGGSNGTFIVVPQP